MDFFQYTLEEGQNRSSFRGFHPKHGVEKKERPRSVIGYQKTHPTHRKESLMHIQVSLIVEIDASADLATIEEQIQEAGHQSMRQALQQAVRHWEQQHRTCPHCGSHQVRL